MSDTSTIAAPNLTRPPLLNYTVTATRKRKIIVFGTLSFLEAGVLPLILFYSIRWGAHLSNTKNVTIITCLVGTYSGYNMGRRMWYLWISDGHHQRRPIGTGRWGVDTFAIMISLAMTGFFTPLIVGSSLNDASVETVAMALPCFMLIFCLPMLITGLFPHRIRLPFRVSSLPAYRSLPPITYTLVEDVVAVDGGGCVEFRQAWRIRYEHSPAMRRILRVTALAWGASGCLVAGALIAVAWNSAIDVGYGCGYGLPWAWAMFLGILTMWWVRRELEREEREWDQDVGEGKARRHMSLDVHEKFDSEKAAAREVDVSTHV